MGILRRNGLSSGQMESKVYEFIIQDLEHLLNSKCGCAWFDDRFGLNDIAHFSSKEDITLFLIDEITRCVEMFTPRLSVESIEEQANESLTRVSFLIECSIKNSPYKIRVHTDLGARRWTVET